MPPLAYSPGRNQYAPKTILTIGSFLLPVKSGQSNVPAPRYSRTRVKCTGSSDCGCVTAFFGTCGVSIISFSEGYAIVNPSDIGKSFGLRNNVVPSCTEYSISSVVMPSCFVIVPSFVKVKMVSFPFAHFPTMLSSSFAEQAANTSPRQTVSTPTH